MQIVGLCHDVLTCAAAIVQDGKVVAAAAEERFDRQKQSRVFPVKATEWCLRHAGLDLRDVDELAIAWNPSIDLETLPGGWLSRRHRGEHFHQVPAQLMKMAAGKAAPEVTIARTFVDGPPITFINHHDAHIGNSYFETGWDEAAICVLDGRAERHTSLLAAARGTRIERLLEVPYPNSLGLFYGTVTQFLGFRPDSDEWKVMALGSNADPSPFLAPMRSLVRVGEDGSLNLALEFFEFFNQFDRRMYSDLWVGTFGKPRCKEDELTDRDRSLAAACQIVFEEFAAKILRILYRRTAMKRLAVSGGCFMNSVFNGKILESTPFEEVFISGSPDDSGTAVGAALFLEAQRTGSKRSETIRSNYWGPCFSDGECLDAVRRCRLPGAETVADPASCAAADLTEGRIVGWFQGAMEFGQRALGHRSILLDPRREDGKEVVNAAVKFRESFRPFAPAILEEKVDHWFDCPAGTTVPFMERVFRFIPDQAARVPAVVHTDGTGRLQTVGPGQGRYRDLIAEFERLTGIPIVLNTSFNLNGEPIICTPEDAIRTFYTCGLEVLYLGNVRISKC